MPKLPPLTFPIHAVGVFQSDLFPNRRGKDSRWVPGPFQKEVGVREFVIVGHNIQDCAGRSKASSLGVRRLGKGRAAALGKAVF